MKTIKNPTNIQVATELCKHNPNSKYASLLGYNKETGKIGVKDLSIFTSNPDIANEFISDMANQIVRQRTYDLFRDYEMPFKVFLREMSKLGDAEQLLSAQLAKMHTYGESGHAGDVTDPFKADKPTIEISFIKTEDKKFTCAQLSYDIWAGAFVSEQGLSNLAGIILKNLRDSIEEYLRDAIKGDLASVTISETITTIADAGETANAQKAYEEILTLVNKMAIPSDDYNASQVKTFTRKGRAVLVLNARYASSFDVNVLASLFNSSTIAMEKYFKEVIVTDIDDADVSGKLVGVVLDEEAYLWGYRFNVSGSIYDPLHLTMNTYNHAWVKRGLVPFRQAVKLVIE